MNALIVYASQFGNTKRVAEVIGEVLNSANTLRVIDFEALKVADFEDVDLVLMGSPTHVMNLPKSVRPVFESLPRRCLKGKLVAAFDTSYKMSWLLNRFTAGKRLAKKLRKLGGKQVVPPEIFLVESNHEGPLFDGEEARARAWGETILAACGNHG